MTHFTLCSYSELLRSMDIHYSTQISEITTTSRVLHCAPQIINFKLLISEVLGHVYLQIQNSMPMWHQNRIHTAVMKTHETV